MKRSFTAGAWHNKEMFYARRLGSFMNQGDMLDTILPILIEHICALKVRTTASSGPVVAIKSHLR